MIKINFQGAKLLLKNWLFGLCFVVPTSGKSDNYAIRLETTHLNRPLASMDSNALAGFLSCFIEKGSCLIRLGQKGIVETNIQINYMAQPEAVDPRAHAPYMINRLIQTLVVGRPLPFPSNLNIACAGGVQWEVTNRKFSPRIIFGSEITALKNGIGFTGFFHVLTPCLTDSTSETQNVKLTEATLYPDLTQSASFPLHLKQGLIPLYKEIHTARGTVTGDLGAKLAYGDLSTTLVLGASWSKESSLSPQLTLKFQLPIAKPLLFEGSVSYAPKECYERNNAFTPVVSVRLLFAPGGQNKRTCRPLLMNLMTPKRKFNNAPLEVERQHFNREVPYLENDPPIQRTTPPTLGHYGNLVPRNYALQRLTEIDQIAEAAYVEREDCLTACTSSLKTLSRYLPPSSKESSFFLLEQKKEVEMHLEEEIKQNVASVVLKVREGTPAIIGRVGSSIGKAGLWCVNTLCPLACDRIFPVKRLALNAFELAITGAVKTKTHWPAVTTFPSPRHAYNGFNLDKTNVLLDELVLSEIMNYDLEKKQWFVYWYHALTEEQRNLLQKRVDGISSEEKTTPTAFFALNKTDRDLAQSEGQFLELYKAKLTRILEELSKASSDYESRLANASPDLRDSLTWEYVKSATEARLGERSEFAAELERKYNVGLSQSSLSHNRSLQQKLQKRSINASDLPYWQKQDTTLIRIMSKYLHQDAWRKLQDSLHSFVLNNTNLTNGRRVVPWDEEQLTVVSERLLIRCNNLTDLIKSLLEQNNQLSRLPLVNEIIDSYITTYLQPANFMSFLRQLDAEWIALPEQDIEAHLECFKRRAQEMLFGTPNVAGSLSASMDTLRSFSGEAAQSLEYAICALGIQTGLQVLIPFIASANVVETVDNLAPELERLCLEHDALLREFLLDFKTIP